MGLGVEGLRLGIEVSNDKTWFEYVSLFITFFGAGFGAFVGYLLGLNQEKKRKGEKLHRKKMIISEIVRSTSFNFDSHIVNITDFHRKISNKDTKDFSVYRTIFSEIELLFSLGFENVMEVLIEGGLNYDESFRVFKIFSSIKSNHEKNFDDILSEYTSRRSKLYEIQKELTFLFSEKLRLISKKEIKKDGILGKLVNVFYEKTGKIIDRTSTNELLKVLKEILAYRGQIYADITPDYYNSDEAMHLNEISENLSLLEIDIHKFEQTYNHVKYKVKNYLDQIISLKSEFDIIIEKSK